MAERHPAISGEDSSDERELLARGVEGFKRRDTRLFFVVDVEISSGREDRSAFGGVPVAKARGL